MTRVFYAATLYSAMGLAAAIDAGMFGEHNERYLLIASTNSTVPEVSENYATSPAFASIGQRFDEIVHWNDVIAPMHPFGWTPSQAEVPLLSRLLTGALGLQDGVSELVLESVAMAPARTIGMLIGECPITVHSDGLMSFGPTRDELAVQIGARTTRLLYLDLLGAVTPLLLRENNVAYEAIPDEAFRKVIAELPVPQVGDASGWPVILGQYLSQLDLLTPEEENRLHCGMLQALVKRGHRDVVFKPHPAAGRSQIAPLQAEAIRLGVRLEVAGDALPAETWFAAARPELVVSCFSTALLTANRYFDIPSATMGTELMLERLTPYENGNRIPLTIVDSVVPQLLADGSLALPPARDVPQLLQAVGYNMQARRHPDLRPVAVAYLAANGPSRYFKKRRLERLGLVAAPLHRNATLRRAVRRARRVMAAAVAARARRRVSAA